jgi:uncharacterized protein (TIGR00369 family)
MQFKSEPTMSSDDTLTAWNLEFEAVRERMRAAQAAPGFVTPAQAAGRSGLDVLQAMLAGELPYPHIAETLDFGIVSVAPGSAVFQGTPQVRHLNPMGGVHGGWYATLLDSALGCAVHTMMPAGRGYTTAELSVNIVRGATPSTGPLRAVATVLHCGRQLATAEARIVGPDGRLYAHGTTTCLVFELPASVPTGP